MAEELKIQVIAVTRQELIDLFDEWLRRYQSDPKEFVELAQCTPVSYGEQSAAYFEKLLAEFQHR